MGIYLRPEILLLSNPQQRLLLLYIIHKAIQLISHRVVGKLQLPDLIGSRALEMMGKIARLHILHEPYYLQDGP